MLKLRLFLSYHHRAFDLNCVALISVSHLLRRCSNKVVLSLPKAVTL